MDFPLAGCTANACTININQRYKLLLNNKLSTFYLWHLLFSFQKKESLRYIPAWLCLYVNMCMSFFYLFSAFSLPHQSCTFQQSVLLLLHFFLSFFFLFFHYRCTTSFHSPVILMPQFSLCSSFHISITFLRS